MILMGLFQVIFAVLKVLFSWLNLPGMPAEITSAVDGILSYVVDALPLLWLFFDRTVVGVCLVTALACSNFDKIYDLLMWILAKIPVGIRRN